MQVIISMSKIQFIENKLPVHFFIKAGNVCYCIGEAITAVFVNGCCCFDAGFEMVVQLLDG